MKKFLLKPNILTSANSELVNDSVFFQKRNPELSIDQTRRLVPYKMGFFWHMSERSFNTTYNWLSGRFDGTTWQKKNFNYFYKSNADYRGHVCIACDEVFAFLETVSFIVWRNKMWISFRRNKKFIGKRGPIFFIKVYVRAVVV